MKRLCSVLLVVSLLLCGCRSQTEVGEPVVVTGLGISRENGTWTLSVQAIEPLRTAGSLSEQDKAATAVYTASGDSVAEALQAFLNETGKRTYILQNRIVVLNLAQCRKDSLLQTLDYFIRNQEGRASVDLVICRGDPSALLDITTGSDAIPAEYVSQMLAEGQLFSQCTTARLLDAERALAGTLDIALPILQVVDGTPQLSGTALFSGDRLAGELTNRETVGLLLAAGESDYCLYTFDGVTYRLEELCSTVQVTLAEGGWQYHVDVSAVSRVVEASAEAPSLRRVEEALAAEITAALTRSAVELGSDPLGLARRAAARYRHSGVTQASARKALPQATFTADVTLSQTDTGFLA